MSLSWLQRKTKLSTLLKSDGDEDADGIALDRLLHGQNIIAKTPKTVELDSLRFQDRDLNIVGTLEFGQYGVIDVVTCRLDSRTYVRKSTEKRFALRSRDQCFPQFERDILLQALKTKSRWAPYLLCAFQTPTHLNLVMDYAEGGSLWDVLESSPHNGKLLDSDLRWWVPQIVSAIHWCHTQGFAHRDIKPQNFVLKQDAHLLLIDFGSAAPLLPPQPDGSQLLPKCYCLLPCGTCDYVSPEILRAHEAALVALEMEDDEENLSRRKSSSDDEDEQLGYGVETDWWSCGAMLYEMAYGVTPFFANEIRHTYQKIMNHERSLRFDESIPVSSVYKDFLSKLLTHPERRIGRHSILEITDHPLFKVVDWTNLHEQPAPDGIHLPQFAYNEQPIVQTEPLANSQFEESLSQGFAFSALFQSSPVATSSPGPSTILRPTPSKSAMQEDPSAAFIGFSWGPKLDAFPSDPAIVDSPLPARPGVPSTPTSRPIKIGTPFHLSTPIPSSLHQPFATPQQRYNTFSTPNNRPYAFTPFRVNTIPRTGTIGRTVQRRDVSDREAMKQLVDCIGMSARKRVLESGRKPRLLNKPASLRSGSGMTMRKELRFMGDPIPMPDYRSFSTMSLSSSTMSNSRTPLAPPSNGNSSNFLDMAHNLPSTTTQSRESDLNVQGTIHPHTTTRQTPLPVDSLSKNSGGGGYGYSGSETDFTDSEGPPSPSPRTGSVLSISRRSATPTTTMTMTMTGNASSSSMSLMNRSMSNLTGTMGMMNNSSAGLVRRKSSGSGPLPLGTRSTSCTGLPRPVEMGEDFEERNVRGGKKTSEEGRGLCKEESRDPLMNAEEGRKEIPRRKREEDTRTTSANDWTTKRKDEVKLTEATRHHGTTSKRRNSDGPKFKPDWLGDVRGTTRKKVRSMSGDGGYSLGDLEEKLSLLIEEMDEIEKKLTKLKSFIR